MNYVVTVLKSGGDFTPRHVMALWRNLEKRLTTPYRFLCLTDQWTELISEEHMDVLPFYHDWPKWWGKLELFRQDMPWKGDDRVLYLDLDTVIVGNIDHLFDALNGQLTMLKGFRYNRWASGVMGWRGKPTSLPYEAFMPDARMLITKNPKGDQQFLMNTLKDKEDVAFWQELLPDEFVSYKNHCRKTDKCNPPEGAKVVCFHGRPRPWEAGHKWIKEARA